MHARRISAIVNLVAGAFGNGYNQGRIATDARQIFSRAIDAEQRDFAVSLLGLTEECNKINRTLLSTASDKCKNADDVNRALRPGHRGAKLRIRQENTMLPTVTKKSGVSQGSPLRALPFLKYAQDLMNNHKKATNARTVGAVHGVA